MKARRVATALVIVLATNPVVARAASGDSLRSVGDLPVATSERLVADQAKHRIVSLGGGDVAGDFLRLTIIDARTLKKTAVATFPPYLPPEQRVRVPKVYAFDAARRLLYVVVYDGKRGNTGQRNTLQPLLLTVGLDSLRAIGVARPITVFPAGVRIMGAHLWAANRLGLVGQSFAEASAPDATGAGSTSGVVPPVAGAMIGEIDPGTAATRAGPIPLRGCQAVIGSADQAAVALSDETAYVGCGTGTAGQITAPGTPAVVGVPLKDPNRQSIFFLPGTYGDQAASYVDDTAGRILLVGTSENDRPGQAVWVFDLAHHVFVGEIAGGEETVDGAAVDPTTGRLYVTIGNGAAGNLLLSTDRGVEIPQGRPFPLPIVGSGPVTVIPSERAFVVPVQRAAGELPRLRVYRDPLPADSFAPAGFFDYHTDDALLADTPQYAGGAQAFGLRVHQIGGADSILQNIQYNGSVGYYSQITTISCNTKATCLEVRDRDRDLYFARVRSVQLNQDEASADAIRADIDPGTQEDYRVVARRSHGALPEDLPVAAAAAAQCRDFGSGATNDSPDGATVSCSQKDAKVEAAATYVGPTDMPGVFSIGASSTTTSVRLDPKLGIVSVATAEARNVVIGADVRIARITSEVTVVAGVAGAAKAQYTRTFEGVVAGGFRCGDNCDPAAAARSISDELGLQFRVELPAFDAMWTPKGSHAHAQREPWEHQQDVALQNQDPTELQVPALRVTYIGDNGLASRTVVEFAATKADVTSLRVGALGGGGGEGGFPQVPALPTPTVKPTTITPGIAPPPGAPGIVRRIVRTIGHGLRIAFGFGVRTLALWLLLGVPAFLFVRRRHLLRVVRGLR
jgi:hypothetical protein